MEFTDENVMEDILDQEELFEKEIEGSVFELDHVNEEDFKRSKNKLVPSHCVCDVLKAIADAQDNVVENKCKVGCERAIQDLLGFAPSKLDSVPIILYCKDSCQPFKATGVDKAQSSFSCVESFIFRVHEVDDDCCAVIELLSFTCSSNPETPCHQMHDKELRTLQRTGIYITIDLHCFCALTCLPALELT